MSVYYEATIGKESIGFGWGRGISHIAEDTVVGWYELDSGWIVGADGDGTKWSRRKSERREEPYDDLQQSFPNREHIRYCIMGYLRINRSIERRFSQNTSVFENHRRGRNCRERMVARADIELGQNCCGGALVSWDGFASIVAV